MNDLTPMSQPPKDGSEVVLFPLKEDQNNVVGEIDSDDTGVWLCKDTGQSITGWIFLGKFFKGWRYLVPPPVEVKWEFIDSFYKDDCRFDVGIFRLIVEVNAANSKEFNGEIILRDSPVGRVSLWLGEPMTYAEAKTAVIAAYDKLRKDMPELLSQPTLTSEESK